MRESTSGTTSRRPAVRKPLATGASGRTQVAVNSSFDPIKFLRQAGTTARGATSGDWANSPEAREVVDYYKKNPGQALKVVNDSVQVKAMQADVRDAAQAGDWGAVALAAASLVPIPGAKAVGAVAKGVKAAKAAGRAAGAARVGTTVADRVGPEVAAAARKAAGAPGAPRVAAPSTRAPRLPNPPSKPDSAYASKASADRAWATYAKRLADYNRGRKDKVPMVSRDSVNKVPKVSTDPVGKAATDTRAQVARANKNLTAEERATVATAKPPKRPKRTPTTRVGNERQPVLGGKAKDTNTPSTVVPRGDDAPIKLTKAAQAQVDALTAKLTKADGGTLSARSKEKIKTFSESLTKARSANNGTGRPSPDVPTSGRWVQEPVRPSRPTPKQVERDAVADARLAASGKKTGWTNRNETLDKNKPGRLSGKQGSLDPREIAAQKKATRVDGLADQQAADTADLMSAGKSNRLAHSGETEVAPRVSQNPKHSDSVPMSGERAARLRPKGGRRIGDTARPRPRRGTTDKPARTYVHRDGRPASMSEAEKAKARAVQRQRAVERYQQPQGGVPGKPHNDASTLPFKKGYKGTPAKGPKKPNRTGGMDMRSKQDVANPADPRDAAHLRPSDSSYLAPTSRAAGDVQPTFANLTTGVGVGRTPRAPRPRTTTSSAGSTKPTPNSKAANPAPKQPKAAPKGAAADGATKPKLAPKKPKVTHDASGRPTAPLPKGRAQIKPPRADNEFTQREILIEEYRASGLDDAAINRTLADRGMELIPVKPKVTTPKAKPAKAPKAPKPEASKPVSADREAGRAAARGEEPKVKKPKAPKSAKADTPANVGARRPRTPNPSPAKEQQIRRRAASIRRESSSDVALDARKMGKSKVGAVAVVGATAAGVAAAYRRSGDNRTPVGTVTQKQGPGSSSGKPAPEQAGPTSQRRDKYGRKISEAEYQRRQAWKSKAAGKSTAEVDRLRQAELKRRARYRSNLGAKAYGEGATKVTRNEDVPRGIPVKTWRAMSPAVKKRYRRISK